MIRSNNAKWSEWQRLSEEALYEELKQTALDISEAKLDLAEMEYKMAALSVINADNMKKLAEDFARG